MTDTEQLIKAALAKQAERAPHAGPILHALSRPRRRFWRGLVVVVVAMLVTGGIAVPVALQSSPDQPAPAPVPVPEPESRDLARGIPMAFGPTYLPPGFVEVGRMTDGQGDSQTRVWQRGRTEDLHLMMLSPRHPDLRKCLDDQARPKTGEGATGAGIVTWAVDGWCLQLSASAGIPAGERQKIVDSMRPDGMSMLKSPVRFGHLPPHLVETVMRIGSGQMIYIDMRDRQHPGSPSLSVVVGPRKLVEQLPVAPHVAHLTTDKHLDDGRTLRVQFSLAEKDGAREFTSDERDRIVRDIKVEPVDLSWLDR